MSSPKPEAVVVGSGLNALGVVRSLAAESVRITVVDETPGGPAAKSRYARANLYARGPNALIAHLRALKLDAAAILFLTQEAAVTAVSREREALRAKYRFLLPPADTLTALMDKRQFQTRAAELGFDVPRSAILDRPSDVDRASLLTYPCILKPIAKLETWERNYKKAYRFETFAALKQFLATVEGETPPLIVQEWIEGSDSDVYFTLVYRDDKGRTSAHFTGRKLRQWPPNVGGTASCTAAPEVDAELADATKRFFDAVGFVGMGSMEYKRDPRTGRFIMVEPTVGRSDYQEEVATLNGVNIPRAAYRSLAGLEPVPTVASPRKRIWRDGVGDERSALAQPEHKLPDGVVVAEPVDALFRVNDPGPWLANLGERIFARLARSRS